MAQALDSAWLFRQHQSARTPSGNQFFSLQVCSKISNTGDKMIDGPVGEMVERSQARPGFKAPPKLMDIRPMALEHPEASVVALICTDPRLNPGEILSLIGIAGTCFYLAVEY
jgi:hypothetical protein